MTQRYPVQSHVLMMANQNHHIHRPPLLFSTSDH